MALMAKSCAYVKTSETFVTMLCLLLSNTIYLFGRLFDVEQ